MTTSRVGRLPVAIPNGVEVKVQNKELTAKGPKGQLAMSVHPYIKVDVVDGAIKVAFDENFDGVITGAAKKTYRSIAGTTRSNINNIVTGVSTGFEKRLTLVGVGYRAQSKGKVIALSLGFSHPTEYAVPEGVTIETPTQTEIVVRGADKELVGKVARDIRAIRPPEPYKGKGVRYSNEVVILKETKKK